MISKRSDQLQLYDIGNVFDVQLPAGSFHSRRAAVASHLFKDEDFAAYYSAKMGRPRIDFRAEYTMKPGNRSPEHAK